MKKEEMKFKEIANLAYPNYEGVGLDNCGLTYDKLRDQLKGIHMLSV